MSDWLDAEAHADRALEWFERGRWAEAEAELRKAIALNPDQSEWHFNLALTLEAAGRDSEALSSYEHAIGLMPDQYEPLVAAGIVCNRLGQFDRAINRFERALAIDRTQEVIYAQKMESHFRLGDHDEVETTFYLAEHELAEASASCFAVLAESLFFRRQFERAEWCLKRALRLDPALPRLRARLGAILAATGRPHRALQMYLRDLRDDPGNIDTLLDFGDLLLELGRFPDAAEKFRRVLELEPANVDAHHRLGRIAMQSRRFEQAQLEFELVYKLDAGYPHIRLDVADSLLALERQGEARQMLLTEREHLARQDERPTDGPGASNLDAIPVNGMYLTRFGRLLLRSDQPSQAVTMLERAAEADPHRADIYRDLALASYRTGDRDRGISASRRALRLDPDCIRSVHNLALAALEDYRLRAAAGWIRRGMDLDRHDVGIRRLRMRLWSLMARRWMRKVGRKA